MLRRFFLGLLVLSGCSMLKEKPPEERTENIIPKKPMPPEEAKAFLKESGENWLYGQGVGETSLAAGTIFVFPPYAIYLLGNAALSMSGYEPVHVSDALPSEERTEWNSVYDKVTEAPGRVGAAVAGEEFRTEEVKKESLKKYLETDKDGVNSKK